MRRRQSIFDFNHIDPSIPKNELDEVKKLYQTYHRYWWCFKRLYQSEKKRDLLEKVSSSTIVAVGLITGGATLNPIVLGVISGVGMILKTVQEAGNRGKKIEKARFAFCTYEKTLADLRAAMRGGTFDKEKFLIEMETIDGIVIDLGLNQDKFEKDWKEKFSTE